MQRKRI